MRGDLVIGVAGTAVILLVTGLLWEIDGRAGPYEEEVAPASVEAQAAGTLVRQSATGTSAGGVCLPGPPAPDCAPAATSVELIVQGLPRLDPHALYALVLSGGSETPWRLGPLDERDDGHAVAASEERDASAYRRAEVLVESRDGASVLAAMAMDLPEGPGQVDLAALAPLAGPDASGRLRATEIGAFALSVTVVGMVQGLPVVADWRYDAWLEPLDARPWVFAGSLEHGSEAGSWVLDGRVERLRLEDFGRVVVTLAPEAAPAGDVPGVPRLEAPLGD